MARQVEVEIKRGRHSVRDGSGKRRRYGPGDKVRVNEETAKQWERQGRAVPVARRNQPQEAKSE